MREGGGGEEGEDHRQYELSLLEMCLLMWTNKNSLNCLNGMEEYTIVNQ